MADNQKVIIETNEKQTTIPISDSNYFECTFETELIIPDIATIVAAVKKKWRDKLWFVKPSINFQAGVKKKIKLIHLKNARSSQECLDFGKTFPGTIFSNVFGLAIAEIMIGSHLPKNTRIMGFDKVDDLPVCPIGAEWTAFLKLNLEGSVDHDWVPWDTERIETAGTYFIIFCD